MTPAIVHLYHRNNWANAKLVDILVHLAAARERYASRLTATERPDPIKESAGWLGFDRLRTSLEWSGHELVKLAEKTPDTTILAAGGIEHPAIDGWAYGEETWP